MKKFKNKPEATPKYKSGKTAMATAVALEEWEPTTAICPECGSRHAAINTMCVLNTYPEQYQYKCSDCGHRWTGYKVQYIGPTQSWPNLEYEDVTPVGQMGWICPKCGGVFAPHISYCINCTQPMPPKITYVNLEGGSIDETTLGIIPNTTFNGVTTTQSNFLKCESFKQQHGE